MKYPALAGAALALAVGSAGNMFAGESVLGGAVPLAVAPAGPTMGPTQAAPGALQRLIAEALKHNPEIAAAAHEKEAALYRVSPAGALDDPMV